jgi:carboxylate-amine ligase
LIDFGIEESVPFPKLMDELLELVDDVLDDLGSREEVSHLRKILEQGTSADRQLQVYQENGGDENQQEALKSVVDHLVEETKRGVME